VRLWEVYPAIDLRGGRVVRLQQGDPLRERSYHSDPLAVAQRWKSAGARWVHVVNLDAAFGEPDSANRAAVRGIVSTGLSVQYGGGVRDLCALQDVAAKGVRRVVLGTAAVENPDLVESAVSALGPDAVAVAIDSLAGIVRTRGWREGTSITARELARQCVARGVRWLIHTAIARDGMGEGLGLEESAELAQSAGVLVIASGGVASLADVEAAYVAGLAGVIIGRALYHDQVKLESALAVGREGDAG